MSPTAIIYPAIAMFLLSLGFILALGLARYRAIHRGDVRISFFRTYNEGAQTKELHRMARHVQNHFEVPPLFYVGVALTFVCDAVSTVAVISAWLFVASRCVHSFIHLGTNNVSRRFFTFAVSLIFLSTIWLSLLFRLLTAK